jgi:hypothetical protein
MISGNIFGLGHGTMHIGDFGRLPSSLPKAAFAEYLRGKVKSGGSLPIVPPEAISDNRKYPEAVDGDCVGETLSAEEKNKWPDRSLNNTSQTKKFHKKTHQKKQEGRGTSTYLSVPMLTPRVRP